MNSKLRPHFGFGEVSERLKEPASKAGSLAKPGSWVRILPSPPYLLRPQIGVPNICEEPVITATQICTRPNYYPLASRQAAGCGCNILASRKNRTASSYLNVTICMTQGPELLSVAVALLLPDTVTTLSSAMSLSGTVIIREVNPLPAIPVVVATILAPKISSFALVVVADPLLARRATSARSRRHIQRRHSPILQNPYIGRRRRLVERHRHRVAAPTNVRRIVDRLP